MYPVSSQTPDQYGSKDSFWDTFAHIPGTIESRIPTLDTSLDAYFDQHFAAIIEDWDLVTESDLHRLEGRLARVSDEINSLYPGKMTIESRAKQLDEVISHLERSL